MQPVRTAAVIAMCLAASAANAEPGVRSAALAALRGDRAAARKALASGENTPHEPPALVVLASIALDEGRLVEAEGIRADLRSRAPNAAEVKLLETLIQVRRAAPNGDWMEAGIEALRRLHPLTETPPLLDLWEPPLLAASPSPWVELRRLDPGSSLLARWCWKSRDEISSEQKALVDDAIRLADGDERLLVHLAVLDVLAQAPAGYRHTEAIAARDALARELDLKEPGATRLMLTTQRPDDEPVTVADVEVLEKAVLGTEPMPYGRVYRELRALFDKLDPAMAPSMAMSGGVQLAFRRFQTRNLHVRLARDNKLSQEDNRRLARALVRLADLLEGQDTLLTSMLGAASLREAAKLTKDEKLSARAESIVEENTALRRSSRCLRPLALLPIAGFHRAMAERQPEEKSKLFVRLQQAGLSCPAPELVLKPRVESPEPATTGCPDDAAK